jgi:hypothetical protein
MMHYNYKCASHHGGPESNQKTDVEKYELNTLTFDLQQHLWKRLSNHTRCPRLSHPDDSGQPSAMILRHSTPVDKIPRRAPKVPLKMPNLI